MNFHAIKLHSNQVKRCDLQIWTHDQSSLSTYFHTCIKRYKFFRFQFPWKGWNIPSFIYSYICRIFGNSKICWQVISTFYKYQWYWLLGCQCKIAILLKMNKCLKPAEQLYTKNLQGGVFPIIFLTHPVSKVLTNWHIMAIKNISHLIGIK